MIEAQDVSSALDRYLKNLQSDRGALVAANESAEVLEAKRGTHRRHTSRAQSDCYWRIGTP